jgi:hypothetical protein
MVFQCEKCGEVIEYNDGSVEEIDIINYHRCHHVVIDRCGYGSCLDRGSVNENRIFRLCDECLCDVLGELT